MHKNNLLLKERFFISHYTFLPAKCNSDSALMHIRSSDTTNPINYFYTHHFDYEVHILEVSYKVTKHMATVKINTAVCYSHYLQDKTD